MPTYDVVVIGAGLAGLSAACELAESGARTFVAGHGMAATHWAHGGVDVAAPPGVATSREGLEALRLIDGHPYAMLADDVEPAVAAHLRRLDVAALGYRGDLDTPLTAIPTAIGGRRQVAIVPAAQSAAARAWQPDERLLVLGITGFKDFWAPYMAHNLARTWTSGGPAGVEADVVELPDLAAAHNLSPMTLATLFDDPTWRGRAFRALGAVAPRLGAWRVAMPAVLGVSRHADVHAAVQQILGHRVFEVATVPPSVPGLRLFEVLRRRLLERGGQIQIGFPIVSVERRGRMIQALHTEAASRTHRLAADHFILATGGIAGGGIRADPDGRLHESVLGLPVEAPPRAAWFSPDVGPHPLEAAGIRTDASLRPIDVEGAPLLDNVHVIGSTLAGMRYLSERCGDGVALASARRAVLEIGAASAPPVEAEPASISLPAADAPVEASA
jgi:glycerol-3-phosphate dehydrogenase subunit B